MEGMVPLLPQGVNAAPLLDVRRLNARLLRSKGSPLPNQAGGALALADAATAIAHWRQPPGPEPAQIALPTAPESPRALINTAPLLSASDGANGAR
jgi:predicted nucleic acid-binding Zn ribbon protein